MTRNKERILTYVVFLMLIAGAAYASTFTNPLCYFVSTGVCQIVSVANPLPVVLE